MTLRAMAMQQRNQRSDLSGVGRAFRRSSMLAERAAYSESIMRMKVICLIVAFSIAFPWRIAVAAPPGTLVVVTAGQGGLMTDTGPLNPHAYRPNEFVIQVWSIYNGSKTFGGCRPCVRGGHYVRASDSRRVAPKHKCCSIQPDGGSQTHMLHTHTCISAIVQQP